MASTIKNSSNQIPATQSSSPSSNLCSQCLLVFQPANPVIPKERTWAQIPFHARPWILLQEDAKASDCEMCSFMIAVLALNRSRPKDQENPDCLAPRQIPELDVNRGYEDATGTVKSFHIRFDISRESEPNGLTAPLPVSCELSMFKTDDPRMHSISPVSPDCSSTSSDQSFGTLKTWIETCSHEHDLCKNMGQRSQVDVFWRPTRLLRISYGDSDISPSLCLVEVEDEETQTADFRYATLSYCWGTFPQTKLLQKTLLDYKKGIDVTSLPKTFTDAISAAWKLGICYLWIDALCIIQDSESDWVRESAMMAKVYAYSRITLAAAASSDSNGGLFRTRNPEVLNGARLAINWGKDSEGQYHIVGYDPWRRSVAESPLLKRAWVFQERLLSPRTVYFASDQLYWECGQLYASEIYRTGGPWDLEFRHRRMDTATRLPKGLEPSRDGRLKHNYSTIMLKQAKTFDMTLPDMVPYLWSNIISQYSNGKLTYKKDKLIAISGVATSFSRALGDDTYVAGSWLSNLPFYLLWYSRGDDGRLGEIQIPTWSWASMATSVGMDLIFRALNPPKISIDVLEFQSLVTGTERTAAVTGGMIRVKGPLVKVYQTSTWIIRPLGPFSTYFYDHTLVGKSKQYSFLPYIAVDYHLFPGKGLAANYPSQILYDGVERKYKDLYALEIVRCSVQHPSESLDIVGGLMLQPTGVKGQFRRVGYFEIVPDKMRRSWKANARNWALWGSKTSKLREGLFKDQRIDERYYEEYQNGLYTISLI